MQLPVILNVNPRSLFNKQENFKTYVKEKQVEIACVSESWETDEKRIHDIFNSDSTLRPCFVKISISKPVKIEANLTF